MKTRKTVLLCLALIALAGKIYSAEIDGHELPDSITRLDTRFALHGCGLRELLFSDIYLLGMYLPEANSTPAVLNDSKTPRIFLLKVLYKGELPAELPDLWREPLGEELSKEYLGILQDLYERVDTGDVVEFAYHPGNGEVIRINGETEVRQSAVELIPALVELWLGEDPVSGNLKRLLLNGECR